MVENLEKINEVLKLENNSLKQVIENYVAERQALRQTIDEVINSNTSLRAALILNESQNNKFKNEINVLNEKFLALSHCENP